MVELQERTLPLNSDEKDHTFGNTNQQQLQGAHRLWCSSSFSSLIDYYRLEDELFWSPLRVFFQREYYLQKLNTFKNLF